MRTQKAGSVVVETTAPINRKPFHEAIIDELTEVAPLHHSSQVVELCHLLNRTKVPKEKLRPLAQQLRELSQQSTTPTPLLDAAERLEAEYQLLIQ